MISQNGSQKSHEAAPRKWVSWTATPPCASAVRVNPGMKARPRRRTPCSSFTFVRVTMRAAERGAVAFRRPQPVNRGAQPDGESEIGLATGGCEAIRVSADVVL